MVIKTIHEITDRDQLIAFHIPDHIVKKMCFPYK